MDANPHPPHTREWFAWHGRQGGLKSGPMKTGKKVRAAKRNLKKAFAARGIQT